jgi:hypothetical protein
MVMLSGCLCFHPITVRGPVAAARACSAPRHPACKHIHQLYGPAGRFHTVRMSQSAEKKDQDLVEGIANADKTLPIIVAGTVLAGVLVAALRCVACSEIVIMPQVVCCSIAMNSDIASTLSPDKIQELLRSAVVHIRSLGSLGCVRRDGPRLSKYLMHCGCCRYIYFIAVYVAAEILALPALPLTASAGYLFGILPGYASMSLMSPARR